MLTSDIGCPNHVNRIHLISNSISKRFQDNYKIHDGYAYDGFIAKTITKLKSNYVIQINVCINANNLSHIRTVAIKT